MAGRGAQRLALDALPVHLKDHALGAVDENDLLPGGLVLGAQARDEGGLLGAADVGSAQHLSGHDPEAGIACLRAWLRAEADAAAAATGIEIEMETRVSGSAFLTPPGALSDLVAGAVQAATGQRPALSTSGGTSDARFVRGYCPVVEFGLVGRGMHGVDERAELAQIIALKAVYGQILSAYFASAHPLSG